MKYPWEQSIWVYIANNTQISEHKESSTEIVIMYWSRSVLIYVSKWIKQMNMASVVDLKELSTFKTWFALTLFRLGIFWVSELGGGGAQSAPLQISKSINAIVMKLGTYLVRH